jgi:hypothetical protein
LNSWNERKIQHFNDDIPPKFESANQTICSKQNPTIACGRGCGLNGSILRNTLNELPLNTLLVEGKTYYAMNTARSCEGPLSAVTISLKAIISLRRNIYAKFL